MVLKLLGCTQRHFDSRVAGMLLVERRNERGADTPSYFHATAPNGQIYIMQAIKST
jgi:hypothetical protein